MMRTTVEVAQVLEKDLRASDYLDVAPYFPLRTKLKPTNKFLALPAGISSKKIQLNSV